MVSDLKNAEVKVGLEIHQQLATNSKLFCNCPVVKSEEFPHSFERRLRPAQSETGRLDPAAVFEFGKGRSTIYLWNPESSCLVEADEEPPHHLSEDAVRIALQVSEVLHANVVDEIHVMRKIVIDGSNTTGFQRTAVVALGGYLDFEGKEVGVQSVTVEEDAARLIAEDGGSRHFSLDRLGVPLVEVALDPFSGSPEEVGRLALHLGRCLRSTGRVARGLGSIRQDLNVSVNGGKVVEVKGVQKLSLLPKVVAYEAKRQMALSEVSRKLREKGITSISTRACEASETLRSTSSKILKKRLSEGGTVVCIGAEGLRGMMGWEPWPGVRLGREVADVARANSLGGIIHSDEFAKQGISPTEEAQLRLECGVGEGAVLVLLAGPVAAVERAVPQVAARLARAADGVPDETRAALDDGETRYMRPRPGAQRMYPETDIPDVTVGKALLGSVASLLKEPWEETVERFGVKYSLSRDMALKLFDSDIWDGFEKLLGQLKLEPSLVASILVDLPVRLEREGVPAERLTNDLLLEVLRVISSGRIAKEAAPDVLRAVGKGEAETVEGAVEKLGLESMGQVTVLKIIDEILEREAAVVKEKGEGAFSPLMGEVMARVRGRADGALVSKLLRERLASIVRKTE